MAFRDNKIISEDEISMTMNSAYLRWCLDNQIICGMVADLNRLIVYKSNGLVEVNVEQFPENFVIEHFASKPMLFANEFIRKLEPTVFRALAGLKITEFYLKYDFKYQSIAVSRNVKYYMLTRMY